MSYEWDVQTPNQTEWMNRPILVNTMFCTGHILCHNSAFDLVKDKTGEPPKYHL